MTTRPAAAAAHTIMFWLLAVMAFALFAPAVLMPLWEESRDVRTYEQTKQASVDRLQGQCRRNEERIAALENDPLVIERIARRDLNYKPPGDEQPAPMPRDLTSVPVRVPPDLMATTPQPAPVATGWWGGAQRWLPNWPYRKLFVEMPNRAVMLLMAGGLLVTAFVLYGPRDSAKARAHPAQIDDD